MSLKRCRKLGSVGLSIGIVFAGAEARLMAWGGHLGLGPQKQERALKADANAEFRKRYLLAPGQDLKRIAPPFPEGRIEYYNSLYTGRLDAGMLRFLVFRQRKDDLGFPSTTIGGRGGNKSGTTLLALLTQGAGIYPPEIEGKRELLETFVEGDFVTREGVPAERLIPLLEKILREECKLPLTLSVREQERQVVVARGRYKFRPVEPNGKQIEIYGQTLIMDGTGGGGSGDFDALLRWVGVFTEPNSRIINEVEEGPKGQVSWHFNARSPFSKEQREEDHDIALVFERLELQTGLTFKFEERKVRVVSVERRELSPK
jgi:hypothetical protein